MIWDSNPRRSAPCSLPTGGNNFPRFFPLHIKAGRFLLAPTTPLQCVRVFMSRLSPGRGPYACVCLSVCVCVCVSRAWSFECFQTFTHSVSPANSQQRQVARYFMAVPPRVCVAVIAWMVLAEDRCETHIQWDLCEWAENMATFGGSPNPPFPPSNTDRVNHAGGPQSVCVCVYVCVVEGVYFKRHSDV